jgi:hypothetical protein
MSKAGEVESSFSERPEHPRSRILVEWLDTTGGDGGSLVCRGTAVRGLARRPCRGVRLCHHSNEDVFVKAGCGKTARPV